MKLVTVLNFETGTVNTHTMPEHTGRSTEDFLLTIYDSLDSLQWMAHDKDPDVFLDVWHTDDIKNECDWLTTEQAREVLAQFANRDLTDDFLCIDTIARELFPEPEEAA